MANKVEEENTEMSLGSRSVAYRLMTSSQCRTHQGRDSQVGPVGYPKTHDSLVSISSPAMIHGRPQCLGNWQKMAVTVRMTDSHSYSTSLRLSH
ncbi:hypothetical protein Pmani_031408 [Petrolisthes manimaculis]|uniref:Uncharacterized protein n=1 Tax=Petrolisthes manimaculis TaxID=1843537 RepID=A0AAE1NVE3_9EUCA|nr:hypothetical protein Pmani_031408 [Petrolisthes manimaculis]